MNYKQLVIDKLVCYPTPFFFTFDQMLNFVLTNFNSRFCDVNEIEKIRNIHIRLPSSHRIHHGGLKYEWGFNPNSEDTREIGTIQDKKTEKFKHVYFESIVRDNAHFKVLLAKISVSIDNITFSWDNDNNIALSTEVLFRYFFEKQKEEYFKALYEILLYFKY